MEPRVYSDDPRTLTALLNGQPTKMPKWMAARWKPFEHLSAKQKCLGRRQQIVNFLRLQLDKV